MHPTAPQTAPTTGPAVESATQLTLGTPNHAAVQHRLRDLLDAVEDARRPDGRPTYSDRHLKVINRLALYADRAGVARISLAQLARDRGWDRSNLCRDVRALVAGGYVIRRPSPTRQGYFEYVIPAMESPVRGL